MKMRTLACLFLLLVSCANVQFPTENQTFIPPSSPDFLLNKLPSGPNGQRDRFGVIIGLNAEDRHRGNISLAYQVLIELGFKYKDIFILDIASSSSIFPKTDTTSLLAVRTLMTSLSKFVEDEDDLIVYVTGHGTLIENQPHLVLNPSEKMSSSEFLASLDDIRPGRGLVIFDQCFWGALLHPKSCRWTTITVSKSLEESKELTFPRQFWWSIRNSFTLEKAFLFARDRDADENPRENAPFIRQRECGIDVLQDNDVLQW